MAVAYLNEAAKRFEHPLTAGVAAEVARHDDLARRMPFRLFQGDQMDYIREGDLGEEGVAFIPDNGTMGSPSVATKDRVSVPLRAIASDMDVAAIADDLSDGQERSYQLLSKVKACWRLARKTMIVGGNVDSHTLGVGAPADPFNAITAMSYGPWLDSNRAGPGELQYDATAETWAFRGPGDPNFGDPVEATADGAYTLRSWNRSKYITVTLAVSAATVDGRTSIEFASSTNAFDGLERMIMPTQLIPSAGAAGDAPDLGTLDKLISKVHVGDEANQVFLVNDLVLNRLLAVHRTDSGGLTPEHTRLPGYNGEVLTYRGRQVVRTDWIPSTEAKGGSTDLSSIYLVTLDPEEGLFMGVANGGTTLNVQADVRRQPVMGWRIEEIGALEDVDHRRTRVKLYCGLGLRSTLAVARASEIKTTA